MSELHHPSAHHAGSGAVYAVAAYLFWGVAPVYFVWVGFAAPMEILAHRIVWSIPLLAILITLARQWPALKALRRRQWLWLLVSSQLISINWLTFIFAVHMDRIAETALGYFINPLVSIALGSIFLGEKMRPWQWLSAGVAASGVIAELLVSGDLPVLGLLLAATFGVYGLVRRQLGIASSVGLGVEATLVAPLAMGYMIYMWSSGALEARTAQQLMMLALGGAVTVTPLIWFASAAVRLPLTVLGFFQYIAPTMSLLLAVFVFAEEISITRWWSFVMIWVGLAIYTTESIVHSRQAARASVTFSA